MIQLIKHLLLPSQLELSVIFSLYPSIQLHTKLPIVLLQSCSQVLVFVLHSSMSVHTQACSKLKMHYFRSFNQIPRHITLTSWLCLQSVKPTLVKVVRQFNRSVSELEHSNPSRNIGPLPDEVVVICMAPVSSFSVKVTKSNMKLTHQCCRSLQH